MSVVEVVPAADRWQLLLDGSPGRRFPIRDEAVAAAERIAERRQAELRVQRDDGSIARQTSKYEPSPGYRELGGQSS